MVLFAIDPGNEYSAYCVMDDKYHLLDFAKLPNKEVMGRLVYSLTNSDTAVSLIENVVIERVASYGMPVGREVFETCEWIGRFSQEAEKKTNVSYIYRKDEKMNLCHSMKATDANIRQALIDRFAKFDLKNGKGTKKNPDYFYGVSKDVWAAIAIAVSKLDMMKEGERNESSS